MLSTRAMQCFIAVVEQQHFAKAAQQLHITPTAISKQIKQLESNLQVQLIVRSTRSIQLTELGEQFYRHCKQIEQEMQAAEQLITAFNNQPQGKCRVLISTILAKQYFLKRLAGFQQRYPEIELTCIFSEEDDALGEEAIDVMLGFPEIPPYTDHLKYRKIMTVHSVLCASPQYLKRYGTPATLDDLSQAKWLSHTLRGPEHQVTLANGDKFSIPKPVLLMNQFDALNEACRQGLGVFLTGDSLVEADIATGKLVKLLPQINFREFAIYLFYRAYDYELPQVRAVVNYFES